jgi:hypothetical protein
VSSLLLGVSRAVFCGRVHGRLLIGAESPIDGGGNAFDSSPHLHQQPGRPAIFSGRCVASHRRHWHQHRCISSMWPLNPG